jgi:hypothetical protein
MQIDEPLYDDAGIPRVLQIRELLNHLTDDAIPTKSLIPMIKKMRSVDLTGRWY